MEKEQILAYFSTAALNVHLELLPDEYFDVDFIAFCMYSDLQDEIDNYGYEGNNVDGIAFGLDWAWWKNRSFFNTRLMGS